MNRGGQCRASTCRQKMSTWVLNRPGASWEGWRGLLREDLESGVGNAIGDGLAPRRAGSIPDPRWAALRLVTAIMRLDQRDPGAVRYPGGLARLHGAQRRTSRQHGAASVAAGSWRRVCCDHERAGIVTW